MLVSEAKTRPHVFSNHSGDFFDDQIAEGNSVQILSNDSISADRKDKVVLCLDSYSLKNPELLGLGDENILDQNWLISFVDALDVRRHLIRNKHQEIWVVSSDTVDGINLAATLKHDNKESNVRYLVSQPTGSTLSRCNSAHLIPIHGQTEFYRLYNLFKQGKPLSIDSVRGAQKNRVEDTKQSEPPLTFQAKAVEEHPCLDLAELDIEEPFDFDPLNYGATATKPTKAVRYNYGSLSNKSVGSSGDSKRRHGKIEGYREKNDPLTQQSHRETLVGRSIQLPSSDPLGVQPSLSQEKPYINNNDSVNTQTVAELISHSSLQPNSTGRNAFVVSVVSGSGGTGKSTISLLTSVLAQKKGYQTLLIDADLQFGDMKYLCSTQNFVEIVDLLKDPPHEKECLWQEKGELSVLGSPKNLEFAEIIVERISELIDYLCPYFDLIVVNTGAFWNDQHIRLIERSDEIFFLIDQRPASLKNCEQAVALCGRCGVSTIAFRYFLNFCSRKSVLSPIDVSCALEGSKVFELKDGGPNVNELINAGLIYELIKTKNSLCVSLESVLETIVYSKMRSLPKSNSSPQDKRSTFGQRIKNLEHRSGRAACL